MERADSNQSRTPRRNKPRQKRNKGRQRTHSRSEGGPPPGGGAGAPSAAPQAHLPSSSAPGGPTSSSAIIGGSGGTSSSTSFSSSSTPSASRLPPNSLFPLFAVLGREEEKELGGGGAGGPVQIDRPTRILMELDRGLRSPRTSDQCEAIFFFARLISTYPWPIIVNTAALKLADLFRNSNNFVRHAVCEALRQCEPVLTAQVLNVDEVLRRIQSVLTSNDPVARAITLRHAHALAPIHRLLLHSLASSQDSS